MAGDAVGRWLGYPVQVARAEQTMFFAFHGTGTAHMLGLQVTLGCSSALLLAPVLLLAGVLLGVGHASTARVLLAAVLAGSLVVVVNVLRLVMSRLGTHLCPNGHRVGPSIATLSEASNSTNVLPGHSRSRTSSLLMMLPDFSNSRHSIRKGCSCSLIRTPFLRSSPVLLFAS